jgi:hypothetical protein
MTYLIDVLTHEKKTKRFWIEATNEEQAKDRLKLRFPPENRDKFTIECIKLDMSTVNMDDMFGTFGGE